MKPNRSGFTLIELLVVIAIIAILAAILFPVFTRVKLTALVSSCASNQKQLGMAFMQYLDDNNGMFPVQPSSHNSDPKCVQGSMLPSSETNWARAICKYIKNYRIYCCPQALNSQWAKEYMRTHANNPYAVLQSYLANGVCLGRSTAMCNRTGKVILLWELPGPADQSVVAPMMDGSSLMNSNWWNVQGPAHKPGDNFLYADGHAKFVSWIAIATSDGWHWDANDPMWNFDGKLYPHDWPKSPVPKFWNP